MNNQKFSGLCFICKNCEAINIFEENIECTKYPDTTICGFENLALELTYGQLFIHLYKYISSNNQIINFFSDEKKRSTYMKYQHTLMDYFKSNQREIRTFSLLSSSKLLATFLENYFRENQIKIIEAALLVIAVLKALDRYSDKIRQRYWEGNNIDLPIYHINGQDVLHVKAVNFINDHLQYTTQYKPVEKVPMDSLYNFFDNLIVINNFSRLFKWKKISGRDFLFYPQIENIKIQTDTLGVNKEVQMESMIKSDFIAEEKGYRFRFEDYKNLDTLKINIENALNMTVKNKANILIFPELSVPPELKSWISEKIKNISCEHDHEILLTIAGSYHEVISQDSETYKCNRSYIYNQFGKELFYQPKKNKFKKSIEGELRDNEEISDIEDLYDPYSKYTIFDFPLGRLMVLICADFSGGERDKDLRDIGVNLIFCPAMTNTLSGKFSNMTIHYGNQLSATTVISNHHYSNHAAYSYVPFKEIKHKIKLNQQSNLEKNTEWLVLNFHNLGGLNHE
ncbi:MAG: hypothetical protein KAX49_05650 [Halanaerobiales bacterium]|nr:hypothetical protein [Halanaerobiales bacterium]